VIAYTARRLVLLLPILVGVSIVAFMVTHALPGDPARIYAGIQADEATVRGIRAEYGFDKPLPVQYVRYLEGLVHGDLGKSVRTRNGVTADLLGRAPATIELTLTAILLALLLSIPLGIFSAVWPGGPIDRGGRLIASLGVSIPDFWLGLLLIFLFYVVLKVAPAPVGRLSLSATGPSGPTGFFTIDTLLSGDLETFGVVVSHLAMPALTLAFPAMAPLIRLTRNATIDVLRSDYVLFARATGLRGARLYLKYVLRNAVPGTVTMAGLIFGYLVGGDVLVEKVFAWPGVGLYVANSLDFNDYPAIQGFVLLSAVVYLLVFLVVDVINSALDPRVRLT
jgi:peptide/nickel transport system permease protein